MVAGSVGFPAWLRHVPRREMGYISIVDPEGPDKSGETLMCVHCQAHWIVQPGSGTVRGFCFMCRGATCGKKRCVEGCDPFEAAVERMEGKQRLFKISTQDYNIPNLGQ